MDKLTTEVPTGRAVARLAAGYARRGWHVLPTTGKRPVIEEWETAATGDPDDARAAWDPRGPWAGRNIAIACGPSQLVVLDLDLKDGRDGFETLRQLGIELPETYSVQTPTGGLHLYYQAPPGVDVASNANVLGSGIDIRAGGGIVVAAGSHIPGKGSYEVASDLPVAALPTALALRLEQASPAERRKKAAAIPDVIPQGERESTLVSLAGTMRRRGASAAAILAALEAENIERCEPPLEQEDLERIAGSVGRYEPADSAPTGPDLVHDEIETDPDQVARILSQMEATRLAQITMKARENARIRAVLGGMSEPVNVRDFIAAGPDPVTTCIWGHAVPNGVMGWASGQGTIIAGPPGTGKSTIALQVILRRCGILDGDVLGMPVAVTDEPLAFLALDRADQIRQSIRRMIPDDVDEEAIERLRMIDNLPPTVDLRQPESFISWLNEMKAGAVVLDSAKDLGFDLNDSAEGQAFNFLVQAVLRSGIDILVTHHSRKVPRGDRKPLTLNDLHGSQWVAAGAGSVLMLDGEAGPKAKRLVHVKPLTVPMPNLLLELDAERGEVQYQIDTGEDIGSDGPSVDDMIIDALGTASGPRSQAQLGRELGKAASTISRAVKRLRDAGQIEPSAGGWVLEGLAESLDEDGFDRV